MKWKIFLPCLGLLFIPQLMILTLIIKLNIDGIGTSFSLYFHSILSLVGLIGSVLLYKNETKEN